jgi:hypothetical protein
MTDHSKHIHGAAFVVLVLIILGAVVVFAGVMLGVWTSDTLDLPDKLVATGVSMIGMAAVCGFVAL